MREIILLLKKHLTDGKDGKDRETIGKEKLDEFMSTVDER